MFIAVPYTPSSHFLYFPTPTQDFTNSAILAYECGYSEEHMRLQMQRALQAGDCGIKASHAQVGRVGKSENGWLRGWFCGKKWGGVGEVGRSKAVW